MNCALVHPALIFESSLPHMMLIYSYLFTYNTFIKILYMFQALPCSSSGGLGHNCIYAASGIITLCRSCAPVKKESRFFFFVYRHSDLEVSCSNGAKTRYGESGCCLRVMRSDNWVGRFETHPNHCSH
jgi:hypothetical protein